MSNRQYLSGSVSSVGVELIRPKTWTLSLRNQENGLREKPTYSTCTVVSLNLARHLVHAVVTSSMGEKNVLTGTTSKAFAKFDSELRLFRKQSWVALSGRIGIHR